jgi:hypothetical protein
MATVVMTTGAQPVVARLAFFCNWFWIRRIAQLRKGTTPFHSDYSRNRVLIKQVFHTLRGEQDRKLVVPENLTGKPQTFLQKHFNSSSLTQ